jgi:hypothetical protein
MKTPEDEAFDDLAKKQGDWGGGFPAKRAMAADKFIAAEERKVGERYGYVPRLHPSEWMDSPITADKLQEPWNEDEWRRNNWRCGHGWLRGEQCEICNAPPAPQPAQEPVAWRRREVGGCWQYFGWEETGMTYQVVERWNKNGFECEAIPATPPQEKNNGT